MPHCCRTAVHAILLVQMTLVSYDSLIEELPRNLSSEQVSSDIKVNLLALFALAMLHGTDRNRKKPKYFYSAARFELKTNTPSLGLAQRAVWQRPKDICAHSISELDSLCDCAAPSINFPCFLPLLLSRLQRLMIHVLAIGR